jgi:hypothetical protein
MREWLFALVPIACIIYFLMQPAQFYSLAHWIASFAR